MEPVGKKVGFPRNLAEEKQFFHTFWHTLSEELGLTDAAREQLRQVEYTQFLRPFPDARPALLTARQQGLQIGVLSNFSLASLESSLTAVSLADLVDSACAATVIGAAKPSAEACTIACRTLGVAPAEALFFDDELACVEGGHAAGLHSYWVDRRLAAHALENKVVCDLTPIPEILVGHVNRRCG